MSLWISRSRQRQRALLGLLLLGLGSARKLFLFCARIISFQWIPFSLHFVGSRSPPLHLSDSLPMLRRAFLVLTPYRFASRGVDEGSRCGAAHTVKGSADPVIARSLRLPRTITNTRDLHAQRRTAAISATLNEIWQCMRFGEPATWHFLYPQDDIHPKSITSIHC